MKPAMPTFRSTLMLQMDRKMIKNLNTIKKNTAPPKKLSTSPKISIAQHRK